MAPIALRDSQNGEAGRLLIIDDEASFASLLASQLEARGHQVTTIADGAAAIASYREIAPEVVILDLSMPGMDGLEVLAALRNLDAAATVILLSGTIDVRTTVRALRSGAEDVQPKPADIDLLAAAISRGLQRSRLIRTNRVATAQAPDPYGLLDDSPAMRRVLRAVERVSQVDAPVLITGEPGTGKHLVAEMLHQLSPRSDRPFVRVSCEGLDEANLKAAMRLFGPTPRAPKRNQTVRAPGGGTLFLHNVPVLSPGVQRQLLAIMTETLADAVTAESAIRVVASAERDLFDDVQAGRLNAALFQRLAAFPLSVPSLRARGESAIRNLAIRLMHGLRAAMGRGPLRLTDESLAILLAAAWPGNVRQLRQVLEEAFVGALNDDAIDAIHLRDVLERSGLGDAPDHRAGNDQSLEEVEKRHIARVLAETGGNRSEAARILEITRTTLYKKIYAFGLEEIGDA